MSSTIQDAGVTYGATAAAHSLFSIGASVSSNALTVTLDPTTIAFRSTTLTSGTPVVVQNASQLSLTVPSSATLGTVNATQSDIYVVAINNAGTMELAVINSAGGTVLNEMGLISTTAISASATSASTFYSTTARSNVAYKVVGVVRSTQATAGTWASAPSLVQGQGGLAGVSSAGGVGSLGGLSGLVVVTSSGSWTVPTGITKCKVTVIGGGGGGGGGYEGTCASSAGSAGGAGGVGVKLCTVIPGNSISATIGSGGAGGGYFASGGNGGTSSFGSFVTCGGGGGGGGGAGNPPLGGTGSVIGADYSLSLNTTRTLFVYGAGGAGGVSGGSTGTSGAIIIEY